jgi:dienelactone hydrolase
MPVRIAYVAFPSLADPPLTVAGKLVIPTEPDGSASTGRPAVIICHGSDGVDGRGEFYAPALQAAGIATLEVDMWAARGTARGATARPRSPLETLPDAFGALKFLGEQPETDAARIGIMGFSWGGVVTLLSAVSANAAPLLAGRPAFKAHAANYPVCWIYGVLPGVALEGLSGAPILLQTGDIDTYDDPDGAAQLLARLKADDVAHIRSVVYAGAGHGFDRDLPAQTINDPAAHKGAGGPVLMAFDKRAATAAREAIVGFFRDNL